MPNIAISLANLGCSLMQRPRGGWVGFELQMIAHGLLGSGWGGVLMQPRERLFNALH